MKQITIDSLSELPKVAELVLESLEGRNVVAFFAPMGAGKTTLISALMEKTGSEDIVTSPTFALVNQYYTAEREPVYHFDFYRISDPDELYGIGFDDYLDGGICIGEWCENIGDLVPEDAIRIEIVKSGENSRIINTSYDFYTEI